MLRAVIMGTLVGFALVACAPASPPSPDLDAAQLAAVEATDNDVLAAMRAGDWTAYGKLVTDNVTWMAPNEKSHRGRAAFEAFVARFASVGELAESNREIRGSGNLAYRTIDYVMRGRLVGAKEDLVYPGKLITVYRRQPDGRWLVETEMWNSNPAS